MKNYKLKARSNNVIQCIMAAMTLFLSIGCASTNQSAQTLSSNALLSEQKNGFQRDKIHSNHNIEGTLPLGIGARFDWLVSDTAEGVSQVYDNMIEPIRRGKIFGRTPYEMNYAILPKSGEAFYDAGSIDTETMKSKYKIQVGMKRNFSEVKDFFDPDFWLAKGRYNPGYAPPPFQLEKQVPRFVTSEEMNELDYDAKYPSDWQGILK